MRTVPRVLLGGVLVAGAVVTAIPASAQEAVCGYPFDCPIGGGSQMPTQGGGDQEFGEDAGPDGSGLSNNDAGPDGSGLSNNIVLPFTGGQLSALLLFGGAGLAGGAVLVAAARKRATA